MNTTGPHMILQEQSVSLYSELEWVRPYHPLPQVQFASHLTIPGPLIGRWNAFLERRFPLRVPQPPRLTNNSRVSIVGLTKRVSSDQLLM